MSSLGAKQQFGSRPILGVGGLVFDNGRVLLVRRGVAPAKGYWSIPGGKLRMGETLTEGVERELFEETGLHVRVGALVEVYERLPRRVGTGAHYVVLDYLCEVTGGSLRAGDDAEEAQWLPVDGLGGLPLTPGAAEVIQKAHRMAAGN
ncbi:MAG: NUDIX hydrolase [Bryobacterales bacterium]|nr:NUDIX hydrolase [Bryobacterales bacterium]MDE0629331.1 NUDIX hydrolase [Bryobacterales bacterium]